MAHILPGGENDFSSSKIMDKLADGGEIAINPIIDPGSAVFDIIGRVVWQGSPTVFGSKVHLIVFIKT